MGRRERESFLAFINIASPMTMGVKGDTPFECLTYQPDGRVVAYHGDDG